jgi:hypothetical protein
MSVMHSDPHRALAYDRMHNDSHGLGGKHLWHVTISYLKATGRSSTKELDLRWVYSRLRYFLICNFLICTL